MKTGIAGCFRGVLLAGALAGCAAPGPTLPSGAQPANGDVVYTPGPLDLQGIDSAKAKVMLNTMLSKGYGWLRRQAAGGAEPGRFFKADRAEVGDAMLEVFQGGMKEFTLVYEDLVGQEINVKRILEMRGGSLYNDGYGVDVPGMGATYLGRDFGDARTMAQVLLFLGLREQAAAAPDQERFEEAAARYRTLAVKPPVTEAQRKFIVQADAFSARKEYAKALQAYRKAVAVDPVAYPEAYFNMALLASQQARYRTAIGFMDKYLLLVPDAKDARAARDKIYEWEALMGGR